MADRDYLASPRMEPPDLEERDFNQINTILHVEFEDVFAEPDGIHTFNCVWNGAFNCYNALRYLYYTLATFVCGPFAALWAGWQFGTSFFFHIWCGQPCIRHCEHCLRLPSHCVKLCVNCCVRPCCEGASRHLESSL